ncbi:hypothetical protein J8L85_09035 [Maribacter sp. MMG018]|uniref:hypothetical protein n=1 Tax=Maribacter sp. MMG018 TaxID=2822688 RepID=UPI001B399468|nr:hypothetical protein [Maribacter sp. MMG018]MBQ4914576.1 hypothetical protein [Maribacter sp. MMG018]
MQSNDITYTNGLGELLAPLLKIIRATGFFEAFVFMPLMTILSVFVFIRLKRRLKGNGTFKNGLQKKMRLTLLVSYYSLCFMVTNVTAVAFKTLIVQEMDYKGTPWFINLVAPLHFYILSVVLAYLWLIRRNLSGLTDRLLCMYIQVGLIGGYYIGIYRLMNEPFNITDPTTGMSGIFFLLWFGVLNLDIGIRLFRQI